MAEVRALEVTRFMRVCAFAEDDPFTVASKDPRGDKVLITDIAGNWRVFDNDTELKVLPAKLVCPACGSGDALVSHEKTTMGYHGTRFYKDSDHPDEPVLNYESADTRYGDGEGFVDDIQCDNHTLLELNFADLVPEGTPPNPDWKYPEDRAAAVISAEDALDQITAKLSNPFWGVRTVEQIVVILRASGRTITRTERGPANG